MVTQCVEDELELRAGRGDGADVLPTAVRDPVLVAADHGGRADPFDRLERGPADQP
jgi:hypothetical protein